jgi:hypothetical protein
MSTAQFTLGFAGFAAEEKPSEARIEMRSFSRSGSRLSKVALSNGRLTGFDATGTEHEVARSIAYDLNGSRHRCNSSCQHARGKQCECACGGAFHGKGHMAGTGRLFF